MVSLLLSYHVILPSFFSIPQEREQHVASAERVLAFMEDTYHGSFFLSFYRGRLQRLKQDLSSSLDYFMKLEEVNAHSVLLCIPDVHVGHFAGMHATSMPGLLSLA
jgi:hypothetical protein